MPRERRTTLSIEGERFFIDGRPTYAGRSYKGMKIEGLLMNSRMVQGIFDDLNPQTRPRWRYPDTGKWDPDRNTREFPRLDARVAAARLVELQHQPAGRQAG